MKTRTSISIFILILAVLIVTSRSASASDIEMLLQAVKSGDSTEVKRLIEKGVDVNVQNKYEETALILAKDYLYKMDYKYESNEIIELLREAGAK